MKIEINVEIIEVVSKFKYLGICLSEDRSPQKEVKMGVSNSLNTLGTMNRTNEVEFYVDQFTHKQQESTFHGNHVLNRDVEPLCSLPNE